jgi:hypothetical protein
VHSLRSETNYCCHPPSHSSWFMEHNLLPSHYYHGSVVTASLEPQAFRRSHIQPFLLNVILLCISYFNSLKATWVMKLQFYRTNKCAFTLIIFCQNEFLSEIISGICVAQHPTNMALVGMGIFVWAIVFLELIFTTYFVIILYSVLKYVQWLPNLQCRYHCLQGLVKQVCEKK